MFIRYLTLSYAVKPTYNGIPRDCFFPLQARYIPYRYLTFGKPFCYSFFTNIAIITTDLIKHNFMSNSEAL